MESRIAIRDLALIGLLGALLFVSQVAMAPLANIEPVSLLVVLFTLHFRRLAPYVIAVFVLLEGVAFGFHLWWICYLYVWAILYGATRLFHRSDNPLFWALVSGAFGLGFGALCSLPYLFAGGPGAAAAYFIAGIPYDLAHCAGNFILMLLFYRPLDRLFSRLSKRRTP